VLAAWGVVIGVAPHVLHSTQPLDEPAIIAAIDEAGYAVAS
jgi:hypothetical protein